MTPGGEEEREPKGGRLAIAIIAPNKCKGHPNHGQTDRYKEMSSWSYLV
jgi:hypothetical protein